MALLIRPISLFCLLLVLAACGGGGGGGGGDAVDRPQARASADATEVNAAEGTVHLDGGESTSPNGDITTWQWRFLSRPEGSEATLDGADTAQASFTPDLPGTYVIQLVVNDGTAASGDTSTSRVTVTALNPNPLAVVPNEINWILGTVQLDGSRSLPPDGGDAGQLVYDWTLTQKPDGSAAELDDGSQVYPRFTADEVGQYQAELVVRYGDKASQPATVNITIVEEKAPPVAAIAPLDETVLRGEIATVDGSPSEDPNGGELQYRWRFTSLPAGASGEFLNGSDKEAQARFVVDSAARAFYRLELCVYNGVSRTCTAPFQVNVAAPGSEANTPPVAVIAPSYDATWEAERSASVNTSGGSSYDLDGDALTYQWELVSAPSGYDAGAHSSLDSCSYSTCWPGFTPTIDGNYQVRLTVSDGEASDSVTETFTAMLGANRPPSASAEISGASTVLIGVTAMFDGEGSTDPDDNRLDYQWTLLDRPDNSQATLQGANTVFPVLTPDQAGPYIVQLVVTDERGWSSTPQEVVLMAKSGNNTPVTRISKLSHPYTSPPWMDSVIHWDAEQPFVIANEWEDYLYNDTPIEYRRDYFQLLADSYDPDQDPLSHLWSLVEAPEGNRMETSSFNLCDGDNWHPFHSQESWAEYQDRVERMTEWACADPLLSPTEPGRYVFEYSVYDGSEFAGPFTATVQVVDREHYPGLLLEVPAGSEVSQLNPPPALIDGDQNLRQAVFPAEVSPGTSRSGGGFYWGGPVQFYTFRLSAVGGDFTLVDLATPSNNPLYEPRFMDLTNDQVITEGYVIPQGSSIDVAWQVVVPDSEIPTNYTEKDALQDRIAEAEITGFFRIQEREGWTFFLDGIPGS